MTPQNKLYEAAKKARTRLGQLKVRTTGTKTVILDMDDYQVVMDVYSYLDQIISAYEQEQPEAIAGEKTIEEMLARCTGMSVNWVNMCKDNDRDAISANEALQAMQFYASQQTAHKDQKITDLSGELHATDKLNQKLQDEIAELKQRISELEKQI